MWWMLTGMLQGDPGVIRDNHQIFKLFVHEAQRVFHDRLINTEDKQFFHEIMAEMASKHFGEVQFMVLHTSVCVCVCIHVCVCYVFCDYFSYFGKGIQLHSKFILFLLFVQYTTFMLFK